MQRPLQLRAVEVGSSDIQLWALRRSKGSSPRDPVLRWLSWDTTSVHHQQLDSLEPRSDPAHDGRELADGLCWDRRAGRINYITLVRKAMPSKAHQVYCGLVSAGNMGWETAEKQQLSCNGGASKGLAEVAGALIHAAPLIMARAAGRSEKACDADPDAETPSLPSSSDIQRNT